MAPVVVVALRALRSAVAHLREDLGRVELVGVCGKLRPRKRLNFLGSEALDSVVVVVSHESNFCRVSFN